MGRRSGAQPRLQSWGVQFLGLGYCTEQNTDGVPSLVNCSLLRNGNRTLHQKGGVAPPNFGGPDPLPPSGCALGEVNRRCIAMAVRYNLQWSNHLG